MSPDRRRADVVTGHARRAEDREWYRTIQRWRAPYQGWELDHPDPLTVEEDPVVRARAVPRWLAWAIVIAAASIWLTFMYRLATTSAPSPGQTTPPVDVSRPSSAALGGAPLEASGTPGTPRAEAQAPSPSGAPTGEIGTVLVGGFATWYDDPRKSGHYAAAGPLIRQALGAWRGRVVNVTSGDRSTFVTLSDSCACGERHGVPTIIDLSPEAFEDLAPLTIGVIRVELELVVLPRTDTPDQHPFDPPEHPDDTRMRLEVRD